jgi:cytochrome b561
MRTNLGRHDAATRARHWLTALLVVGAVLLVLCIDSFDDDGAQERVRRVHEWLGVCVLLVTLVRALRLGVRPRPAAGAPLAARAMHLVLVVLLGAVPLLGWAYTSAKGHPPAIGPLALPALVAADLDAAERLHDWHAYAAWTLLAAAGAHALAALHHHFVRRDDVLRAMLPWRARIPVENPDER